MRQNCLIIIKPCKSFFDPCIFKIVRDPEPGVLRSKVLVGGFSHITCPPGLESEPAVVAADIGQYIGEHFKGPVVPGRTDTRLYIDVLCFIQYRRGDIIHGIVDGRFAFRRDPCQVKCNAQVYDDLFTDRFLQRQLLRRAMREKIKSVSNIHEHLLQNHGFDKINIAEYILSLVTDVCNTYNCKQRQIDINPDIEPVQLSTDTATSIGQLVNELMLNALKYAFNGKGGRIDISLFLENDICVLKVKDNGIGLPVDIEPHKANSYGMQLISLFIKQLKGTLSISRKDGTLFEVTFQAK